MKIIITVLCLICSHGLVFMLGTEYTKYASIRKIISPQACDRHWVVVTGEEAFPYDVQDYFVCEATGRKDDASITFDHKGSWHVWVKGAGYGEFTTRETARAQAENILRLKGY